MKIICLMILSQMTSYDTQMTKGLIDGSDATEYGDHSKSVKESYGNTSKALENDRLLQYHIKRLKSKPDELKDNILQEQQDIEGGIHLIGWQWSHTPQLRSLWLISMFLLLASLIKVGYHHSNFLTTAVPESCLLIVIGLVFASAESIFGVKGDTIVFDVNSFFFCLLPPIILESAYTIHDRAFMNNLGTILLYAIFGTLINIFFIGFSLSFIRSLDIQWLNFPNVPLIELMAFATAVSAVDPVSVLAIFQDLGVNKVLYFMVFGESLLNDAIALVIHRLLSSFIKAEIVTSIDIINGFVSFIFVSGGGILIGIIFGIGTALITLWTKHVRVVEPMVVIVMSYLAFLTAELFHWSGFIAIIGCGLVQAEYAFSNISPKSHTTVKYFTQTLSSISELIIFFFLGTMLIDNAERHESQKWNTAFVVFSTIFCIIYRFFSVFTLSAISNNYFYRVRFINLEEQILMSYGGLRGALAFAVIAILDQQKSISEESIDLFRTTALFIILFSVFILGGTTKPLLKFLRIQTEAKDEKKLFVTVNDKIMETTVMGVEAIAGTRSYLYIMWRLLSNLSEKYLRQNLTVQGKSVERIERVLKKIKFDTEMEKIFGEVNDDVEEMKSNENETFENDDEN